MLDRRRQMWAQARLTELKYEGLGLCAAIAQILRELRDGPD